MDEAQFTVTTPQNEPVHDYAPGSSLRKALKQQLDAMAGEQIEIPVIVGGQEIFTGNTRSIVMPHDHGHVLAKYHLAGPEEIRLAIAAAREAWLHWPRLPWPERVSVFLRAGELLAGPYRAVVNAATMLGQSKTAFQAEIDAACETIDFFRFNSHFVNRIYSEQPESTLGQWDRLEWRPLEGFVLAITPFNFTSIAANLPSAPAMMGNTTVWKPASTAVYSGYYLMKLFMEAGLPPGVINFVPSAGAQIGELAVKHPDLAGIHFTGSTPTFCHLWKEVGENVSNYRSYPRLVGETGGKDFIVVHPSADVEATVCAMVRGAFEYQGQKCSAASRAYVPKSLWGAIRAQLVEQVEGIEQGDPRDFRNFTAAVIDEAAFHKIVGYIEYARAAGDAEIIAGGTYDSSQGYFIRPTLVVTTNPHFKTMEEEIFGPVLTLYVYPDEAFEETLTLCDQTSPYALTGSVFATDRWAIHRAHRQLRYAAGNFYVNDKPTGAVVGLQPFGGSRASGTNDKAGSMLNLLRWTNPRTVKETFLPPRDYRYPHMLES